MAFGREKLETVKGHRIAPPRLTFGAAWAAIKYVLLPMIVVLGSIDLALYLFFRDVLGSCYGLFCLL